MKSKATIIILVCAFISSWSLMCCALSKERGEDQLYGQTTAQFTIVRMVIAADIQDREPVGAAETFPASTEYVYCFIEAKDIAADVQVSFVWYYEGKEVHRFMLPLGKGPKWRTFSSKNLYGQKGPWKVELRDSAGNIVKTVSFAVE
jgi:hypothetical protein